MLPPPADDCAGLIAEDGVVCRRSIVKSNYPTSAGRTGEYATFIGEHRFCSSGGIVSKDDLADRAARVIAGDEVLGSSRVVRDTCAGDEELKLRARRIDVDSKCAGTCAENDGVNLNAAGEIDIGYT